MPPQAADVAAAAAAASATEWDTPLYRMAVAQFERSAQIMDLDDNVRARLLEPRRSLIVNFPVRMDDGSVDRSPATASSTR